MKFRYLMGVMLCAVQSFSYAAEITGTWKSH